MLTSLPIDVIPSTTPPRFVWEQRVNTPEGKRTVQQQGTLPVAVEEAVKELIAIAKQLAYDNANLQGQVAHLEGQIAKQEADADKPKTQLVQSKKGR